MFMYFPPFDPVEIDPDAEPGGDIDLCIQGAPVGCILGSDNFPCLDDDQRGPADDEALELAHIVVRAVNAHADLLAALETAVRWLRRLEVEYPGCLNEDAIGKHLTPVLVRAKE